jgi:hypothetical protein
VETSLFCALFLHLVNPSPESHEQEARLEEKQHQRNVASAMHHHGRQHELLWDARAV